MSEMKGERCTLIYKLTGYVQSDTLVTGRCEGPLKGFKFADWDFLGIRNFLFFHKTILEFYYL